MPGVKGRSGGQNAKTVTEHQLAGTFKKRRHGRLRNPDPPLGAPVSPKKLAGDALAEWVRMLERLTTCHTLSSVDGAALYQYCRLFAETEALAVLQEETAGSVDRLEENLSDITGADLVACFQEIVKLRQLESRYTTQVRQGRMAQRVFLVEFGLTPASRGRVKLPEPSPKDEWAEFDGDTVQ